MIAMFKMLYLYPIRFPKVAILTVLIVTVLALSQLAKLEWETDARVYFPKGHPAIEYDELVADVFGAKDSIVIGIVNEDGIFNTETLARVKKITEKLTQLPLFGFVFLLPFWFFQAGWRSKIVIHFAYF